MCTASACLILPVMRPSRHPRYHLILLSPPTQKYCPLAHKSVFEKWQYRLITGNFLARASTVDFHDSPRLSLLRERPAAVLAPAGARIRLGEERAGAARSRRGGRRQQGRATPLSRHVVRRHVVLRPVSRVL